MDFLTTTWIRWQTIKECIQTTFSYLALFKVTQQAFSGPFSFITAYQVLILSLLLFFHSHPSLDCHSTRTLLNSKGNAQTTQFLAKNIHCTQTHKTYHASVNLLSFLLLNGKYICKNFLLPEIRGF